VEQSAWHNDQAPEELWPPWRLHQSLGSIFRRPAGPCTSCYHLFAQRPHLQITQLASSHDTTLRERDSGADRSLPAPQSGGSCRVLQRRLASAHASQSCSTSVFVPISSAMMQPLPVQSRFAAFCGCCVSGARRARCARAAWLLSSQFLRDLGRRTGTCTAMVPFMR
jgi:hypothetical protein